MPHRLSAALEVSSAGAAASHSGVEDERDKCEPGGDPHEKHAGSHVRINIKRRLCGGGIFEDEADHGSNDTPNQYDQEGQERDQGHRQSPPPGEDGDGGKKDHNEGDDGAGKKKGKHDVGADLEDTKDLSNFGGQCYGGPGEKLVQNDFDWVEPVVALGAGASCDAFIVVALTEVPQARLVEVVEADATGDGVDELGILNGSRDDVGK